MLLANNDLELYDDAADPDNLHDLANDPARHKETAVLLRASQTFSRVTGCRNWMSHAVSTLPGVLSMKAAADGTSGIEHTMHIGAGTCLSWPIGIVIRR